MRPERIKLALYRIYWKESSGGGSSVASVFQDSAGNQWIAPCNWVCPAVLSKDIFRSIKRIELITKE